MSESFTNVAARATASFDGSSVSGSTSSITATISYNSGSQSYTLSTPTGSITFGPGDVDASQSNAGAVVYVKTSGNRTDSLTLTRPGTSGPLTYRYVGGAFWQRITQTSATSLNGSIDSIVYGVETVAGDVPVSGSANYDIDLIGARTTTNDLLGLAGDGTAAVDFASGDIVIVGRITIGSPFGHNGSFFGSADIGSNGTFAGTLTIQDGEVLDGALAGRFFGPDAAEIGAAFRVTGPVGMVATGAILGRRGSPDTPNASFPLTSSATFAARQSYVDFDFTDSAPGFSHQTGNVAAAAKGAGTLAVRYDKGTNTYLLVDDPSLLGYSVDLDRFIALDPTESASWRGAGTGSGGYPLAGEFGVVTRLEHFLPAAGGADYRYAYQLFGMPTANADLVRTGGAAYRISVSGVALDNAYTNPMQFGGTGDLNVALASGAVSGDARLDYVMMRSDASIPAQSAAGDWAFTGTVSANANLFQGTVSLTGIGNYSGDGSGQIFGPAMEEVGGVFTASKSGGATLAGAFYGARDPATAVAGGLPELDEQTLLRTFTDSSEHHEGELISIAFEPGFGGYFLTFEYLEDSFAPPRVISYRPDFRDGGDDTEDVYNTAIPDRYAGSGLPLKGRVERIGEANPEIRLTYLTIGDAFIVRSDSDAATNDYHVFATGLRTGQTPITGTATYSGIVGGFARVQANGANDNYEAYRLDGDSSVSVNFATKSLTGNFSNLTGTLIQADNPASALSSRSFTAFGLSAAIVGDGFSGSQTASGWTRTITGGFFGPQAEEVGGIFSADFGTPGVSAEVVDIDGSFAAVKN